MDTYFQDMTQLPMNRLESSGAGSSCYRIRWQALAEPVSPLDCWETHPQGNWYGGGERLHESWPLEKVNVRRIFKHII